MGSEVRPWMTLASAAATVGLLAVAGCNNGGNYVPAVAVLPKAEWNDQPDPGRGDPWARFQEFEYGYRSSMPRDSHFNYATEYKGLNALVYPKAIRREAAWDYVLISRDFSARGELAPASRAAWDALSLVRKTVASRPDRERIRRAAYRELSVVARKRNQHQWAELMDLCVAFVDVYLETPKAKKDERAFFRIIEKAEEAKREQERAEAAADRAAVFDAISTGVNMGASYAAAGNSTQAQLQASVHNIQQGIELGNRIEEQSEAIREAARGGEEFLHDFPTVVADDVTEIEAGLSFAAREATFFMLSAEKTEPYLNAVKAWAKDKPRMLAILERVGDNEHAAVVIARELQARELHAARYERRGQPMSYPETVPADPSSPVPTVIAKGPAGRYRVTKGLSPDGHEYGGSLEVEQYGHVVNLQWDLGSEGKLVGVGLVENGKLYAGWSARSRDVGFTLYAIEGLQLVGSWTNLAAGEATGSEVLQLGNTLDGRHKIVSAKLPGTGAPYEGSVSFIPTRETFDVRWDLGADTYRGTGIKVGNLVATGWAPANAGAGVSVFDIGEDSLTGIWAAPGSAKLGHEELRRR